MESKLVIKGNERRDNLGVKRMKAPVRSKQNYSRNLWASKIDEKRLWSPQSLFTGDSWINDVEEELFQKVRRSRRWPWKIVEWRKRSSHMKKRSKWKGKVLDGSFLWMIRSSRAIKGSEIERNIQSWALKFYLKG